jgi:hypothetical protein
MPLSVKNDGWRQGTLWDCTNRLFLILFFVQNFCLGLFYFKAPGSVSADRLYEVKQRTIKTGARIIRQSDGAPIYEIFYELGAQNLLLMDLNLETYGFNRQEQDSSLISYVRRVWR